jgi:hypothetical protein
MKSKLFTENKRTVFNGCLTALGNLDCDIESDDFAAGKITASMSGSLLSYGHNLEIIIKTADNNKTKVSVTSSSIGIQVIDWGTNSNNEEDFITELTNVLK